MYSECIASNNCTVCYMELREGDVAENQNIRSSRGAAEYNLTFEMVLPGGPVQFGFFKLSCWAAESN